MRDLGLTIEGTALEPLLETVRMELRALGFEHLQPSFYLSTEWGVAFGTVGVAIPFYLTSPELTRLHLARNGYVEGEGPTAILRYLRHELGHVVNYAYRLYERADWAAAFGPIAQPYRDEYRPIPFDRRFVRHLPGWYAQKHPDEDWAETFAVCIAPGSAWRVEYADAPIAAAKLAYCARALEALAHTRPIVVDATPDEDLRDLRTSLDQHYASTVGEDPLPRSVLASFRDRFSEPAETGAAAALAALIGREETTLIAEIYRWSGHFPERTLALLRQLSRYADAERLVYSPAHEPSTLVALTAFVTTLGMNFVREQRYCP